MSTRQKISWVLLVGISYLLLFSFGFHCGFMAIGTQSPERASGGSIFQGFELPIYSAAGLILGEISAREATWHPGGAVQLVDIKLVEFYPGTELVALEILGDVASLDLTIEPYEMQHVHVRGNVRMRRFSSPSD